MSDSETITATEASRGFSDLLHRVCYKGESFLIKKGSRVMAKIVPADEKAIVGKPAKPAKKIAEKTPTAPAPKSPEKIQKSAPVKTPTAAGMNVPENFTQEDVDFYQNLIANMGSPR